MLQSSEGGLGEKKGDKCHIDNSIFIHFLRINLVFKQCNLLTRFSDWRNVLKLVCKYGCTLDRFVYCYVQYFGLPKLHMNVFIRYIQKMLIRLNFEHWEKKVWQSNMGMKCLYICNHILIHVLMMCQDVNLALNHMDVILQWFVTSPLNVHKSEHWRSFFVGGTNWMNAFNLHG